MMSNAEILERAGWFLVHTFWIGLLCVPVVLLLKRGARGVGDETRAMLSLCAFGLVSLGPLFGAGFLTDFENTPAVERSAEDLPPQAVETAAVEFVKTPPTDNAQLPRIEYESESPSATPVSHADREQWRLVQFLPLIWLFGTGITACLLTVGLFGSFRLRGRVAELPDAISALARELLNDAPGSNRVRVRISEFINSPILLGIVRPIILLPASAVGWTPETLRFVLLHEVAHARRWDNLINLLQRLTEAVCFYQPAVWLSSAWVRAEREACCDRFVVNQTQQPVAYAETLVRLADEKKSRRAAPANLVTCSSTRHALVERVARLVGKEESMKFRFRTLLMSAITLGLALTAGYSVMAQPNSPQQERSSSTEDERKVEDTKKRVDETDSDQRSEDELLRDVHDFRVEVWDEEAGRFVMPDDGATPGTSPFIFGQEAITGKKIVEPQERTEFITETTQTSDSIRTKRTPLSEIEVLHETKEVRVELIDKVVVSAARSGAVKRIRVAVGDRVDRGSRLGSLDSSEGKLELDMLDMKANSDVEIQSAATDLKSAEINYAIVKKHKSSYTAEEIAARQLLVEQAKLAMERAKAERTRNRKQFLLKERMVARGELVAPISGTVSAVRCNVGQVLNPGDTAIEIVSLKRLRVVALVPLDVSRKLRPGMLVRFTPGGDPARRLIGTVRYLAPEASVVSQKVEVHCTVDSPKEKVRAGEAGTLTMLNKKFVGALKLPLPKATPKPPVVFKIPIANTIRIKQGSTFVLKADTRIESVVVPRHEPLKHTIRPVASNQVLIEAHKPGQFTLKVSVAGTESAINVVVIK